jgi:hypothetical protein
MACPDAEPSAETVWFSHAQLRSSRLRQTNRLEDQHRRGFWPVRIYSRQTGIHTLGAGSMSAIEIFRHLRRLSTGTTRRLSIFPNDGLAHKGTTSGTCDTGFSSFAELQAIFLAEPTAAA